MVENSHTFPNRILSFNTRNFFLLQKARQRSLAVWIRERILQLGPTFIKLGQLSSTRSDLFPAEIVEELSKLQVYSCSLEFLSTL